MEIIYSNNLENKVFDTLKSKLIHIVLPLLLSINTVLGQHSNKFYSDSAKYEFYKDALNGCWGRNNRKPHGVFKYSSANNWGFETTRRIITTAPMFSLAIIDGEICMVWHDVLGDDIPTVILKIKKDKLVIKDSTGRKFRYQKVQCKQKSPD